MVPGEVAGGETILIGGTGYAAFIDGMVDPDAILARYDPVLPIAALTVV